jgi:ribosomally synthesized peptide (two-chain TOMM family)
MNRHNEAPFPKLRTAYLRAIARAWIDKAYQDKLVAASEEPRGVLPMLESDFNFKFPFDVRLAIDVKHRPIWAPRGSANGWFGFADEFEVSLPGVPENAKDGATVLAHYCAEFPSLLGQGWDDAEAPPDFADFGVITSRVVALSWADKKFAHALFDNADASPLIEEAMDYIIPWHFKLKFNLVSGPTAATDKYLKTYWKNFPRSKITVHLPKPPEIDSQPIALAAYNDTGGQYPFTCG